MRFLKPIDLNHYISITFGSTLIKFKDKLSTMSVGICSIYSNTRIYHYLADSDTEEEIENISAASNQAFKDFILSPENYLEHSNCRALKKAANLDKVFEQFKDDEQLPEMRKDVSLLLKHIDNEVYKYYAVTKSLEGSILGQLPNEMLDHIFHYVDGDIKL